jgi:hypothetical protein
MPIYLRDKFNWSRKTRNPKLVEIHGYEIHDVMLDLRSNVNILPKKSQEIMGTLHLVHPIVSSKPLYDLSYKPPREC